MGALTGIRGQVYADRLYDASGSITTGGTPQLILPVASIRSSLILENTSTGNLFVEFGAARATATLTNGAVSSFTVTNAGMGYTRPPKVLILGGAWGPLGNPVAAPAYSVAGLPDWTSPNNIAQAHCVMTGSAGSQTVSSIVVDNGGAGYAYPPFVFLINDPLDPFGSAAPSATSGLQLIASGGSYTPNGSVCTTDQVAIYGATTGQTYTCKFTL